MTENNTNIKPIEEPKENKGFFTAARKHYENHKTAWKIAFFGAAFATGAYIFVKSKKGYPDTIAVTVPVSTPAIDSVAHVAEETAPAVAETVGELVGQIVNE